MANRFHRLALLAFCLCLAMAIHPERGNARDLQLIRDAEIEDLIRDWCRPIFEAAGLEPGNIDIFLVKDKSLNAFVAGGQKLFLHTGFLQETGNPGQVKGVIAHETGHIAGGHLSRTRNAAAKSQKPAILGALLGIGAAIGGRGDVAAAVIAGSQGIGQRNFLAFSRTQEGAADQAAVRYLTATKQSALGLVEFLRTIEDQELLVTARQDPYTRSHPVTAARIDNLLTLIKASPYAEANPTSSDVIRHRRMVAKLDAFVNPIGRTLRAYKKNPETLEARYALAIAHYRRPDLDKALGLINGLIRDYPNDPYFWELKGQMLRENGRVEEALEPYRRSVELHPTSALLRGAYAQTQLNVGDPALLNNAIENLEYAVTKEPRVGFYWRQLAIAYGQNGDQGLSSVALAEEAILKNDYKEATFYAERAVKLLPEGSPRRLQAQDILNQAQSKIPKKKN